jgi:hypothetical protein
VNASPISAYVLLDAAYSAAFHSPHPRTSGGHGSNDAFEFRHVLFFPLVAKALLNI